VAGFFVTVLYYPFFWVQMAMTVALYSVASRQAAENRPLPTPTNQADRKWPG